MSLSKRDAETLDLRAPASPGEREQYYDLRWRILRAPWDQPRGSERDEFEATSVHLALWDRCGDVAAVGRLHLNSPAEAQVRFMAVEPAWARLGLGSRILGELEARARDVGAESVVLNARDQAVAFYRRHGYTAIRDADTLFGAVAHVRMAKRLG